MDLISATDPSSQSLSPGTPAPDDLLSQEPDVSSQVLGEEICSLASRISTATARLIFLLAEFDAREAWAGYGVKSCAHWLSWQCHIGTHTAREHVRVARALRDLPLLTAEFGAGRLSYAKVRALTRIATPDCETDLVNLALAATTAHVERTVTAWHRVDTLTDPDRAAKPPVAASTNPTETFDDHLSDPAHTAPHWQGEPLHLDYVLTTLISRRDQLRKRRHSHEEDRAA